MFFAETVMMGMTSKTYSIKIQFLPAVGTAVVDLGYVINSQSKHALFLACLHFLSFKCSKMKHKIVVIQRRMVRMPSCNMVYWIIHVLFSETRPTQTLFLDIFGQIILVSTG